MDSGIKSPHIRLAEGKKKGYQIRKASFRTNKGCVVRGGGEWKKSLFTEVLSSLEKKIKFTTFVKAGTESTGALHEILLTETCCGSRILKK